MGGAQSADVHEAVDEAEQESKATGAAGEASGGLSGGIKLFKFIAAGDGGNWEVASSNAHPKFRDANEDSGKAKSDYYLEIDEGDIDARVDESLNQIANIAERRVTFQVDGVIWALRYPNVDSYRTFVEKLSDCSFYNVYGAENDEEGRRSVFEDMGTHFFSNTASFAPMEVDPQPEAPSTAERVRRNKQVEVEEDEDDAEVSIQGILAGAGDNTYLQRGSRFDVLRNEAGHGVSDGKVSFHLTPTKGSSSGASGGFGTPITGRTTRSGRTTNMGTPGGAPRTPGVGVGGGGAFTPGKVLLAQNERKMNMLTPDNPNLLHHADIETQRIVSTWNFQKDGAELPILDIAADNKAAQLESRSTFMGLNKGHVCRWDLRTEQGVVAESPVVQYKGGKEYASKPNFTCIATTGDGYVAVGSKDGKVRLYSTTTLQQAKTAIPGLGAPVTAIDVTYDGKWVLATTDHYLMVVKTTFEDDKGRASNAFTAKMGGRGAVPRLLRLKPEDALRTGNQPFTKAKFTWITESGSSERWIAASVGRFSVIWNFTKIKSGTNESLSFGGLPTNMDYVMTQQGGQRGEAVADLAFMHSKYADHDGEHTPLIVATAHTLYTLD